MEEFQKVLDLGENKIEVSTGKVAFQAAGSVVLKMGGTTVLATTGIDKKDVEQDFFPLSVEYIEKMYARGAISGSRFQKREGFPSEEAIVKARQVDHSIRSLFPKGYRKPVTVILTVLSYDDVNDPEILAVFGASLSIVLSKAPFFGPCSSVVACIDASNNIIINPPANDRESYRAEFLISGVDGKVLSIEGWGKEIEDELMDKVLDEAMLNIEKMNAFQIAFAKELGIEISHEDNDEFLLPAPKELIDWVKENKYDTIKNALFVPEKQDRNSGLAKIKEELGVELKEKLENKEFSSLDLNNAVEYIARKILREGILKEDKRVSPRGLREIRPLSAEVDVLPTVHGSALFTRGLTQSLSIVTLGAASMEQIVDDMEGETTKRFMHHYNMPPFSTGEAGRYSYKPGRREIGHGAIGENGLENMLPSEDEFPYTIRVVSEILSSNGSTSMAATCASSMALMAAGVPMKSAVAGIGVGLVTEDGNEDNYKLLLDIEGIEDFYGDMDFKVTGTKDGLTAIQYENKLKGVKPNILKEAFRLANTGRMQVLETMNNAIASSRSQLAENAPVVETVQIRTDQIAALIGPGGKNIKELVANTEKYAKAKADIAIDDNGKVTITALNREQLDFVKQTIGTMFEEAQVGKLYEGAVDKIMPYGIFVNVSSNISGLCHISEISANNNNPDLNAIFKEGDRLKVKVLKIEGDRLNFTLKDVEQDAELQQKIDTAPTAQRQEYNGNGGERRFGGDRDRRNGGGNRRRF